MNDTVPLITEVEIPVVQKSILVIEDEKVFARAVKKRLEYAGFEIKLAPDLKSAEVAMKQSMPDLVLLDMRLPDGSGLDFLQAISKKMATMPSVIAMSAYGELEDAVSAMKMGAADYLKKPIDLDELLLNINKVLASNELNQKLGYSNKREQHATENVEFLGQCADIEKVRQQVSHISSIVQNPQVLPPTVLILGETGTGKDVVARMLHAQSCRHHKSFVHVDCASLPRDLIEAELFGHEKGAFTNAHVSRTGLIEAAEDGVLFLDEVGELSHELQAKLLAVLERRVLRRIGATREKPVAAWFIAATNRDLHSLQQMGEFRSDLYYRLNVMSLTMPPLRIRGQDIHILAEHFVHQTARRYGLKTVGLMPETIALLEQYTWPGNVREIKHMLERAMLLNQSDLLSPEHLGINPSDYAHVKETDQIEQANNYQNMTLDQAEINMIKHALDKNNHNVCKAARELGISRMALRYRIKKYNLS